MFTEKSNSILEEKQVILGNVLFEHQIAQSHEKLFYTYMYVCIYMCVCTHIHTCETENNKAFRVQKHSTFVL